MEKRISEFFNDYFGFDQTHDWSKLIAFWEKYCSRGNICCDDSELDIYDNIAWAAINEFSDIYQIGGLDAYVDQYSEFISEELFKEISDSKVPYRFVKKHWNQMLKDWEYAVNNSI